MSYNIAQEGITRK